MSEFDKALPYVLRHEGGWSDDPDDPGGATMQGITLKTASRHGIHTKAELRNISPDKVAEIYRIDYWRFNGLDDQRVAGKIFDMAVNFGLGTTVRLVQEILNALGAGLTEDGIWGPKTENTVNAVRPDLMIRLLCQECEDHYNAITAKSPTSKKFLKGWLRRANEVPTA